MLQCVLGAQRSQSNPRTLLALIDSKIWRAAWAPLAPCCTLLWFMLLFSHVKSGTLNLEWWCQFLHTKAKIYSDVDDVRGEIERETDRMAGLDNNKISLCFHFCKKNHSITRRANWWPLIREEFVFKNTLRCSAQEGKEIQWQHREQPTQILIVCF